jgi:hypothetical protein
VGAVYFPMMRYLCRYGIPGFGAGYLLALLGGFTSLYLATSGLCVYAGLEDTVMAGSPWFLSLLLLLIGLCLYGVFLRPRHC